MTALRVVLAEDQPMVRAGFRALLESTNDIEVVGEAATGGEALERVRALRPDVIVMDIRMPEMDGLEATRRITSAGELSETHVLVLTTFELDEYVFGALDAGASGFLLKGGEPADLVHAIRTVAGGEALLAPTELVARTRTTLGFYYNELSLCWQCFISQLRFSGRALPQSSDSLAKRSISALTAPSS